VLVPKILGNVNWQLQAKQLPSDVVGLVAEVIWIITTSRVV
jgi:hypothetical protein